ncbi:MAG: transcriptional repressor LexA [Pseudomonadales bacterium]|nr:transcriptional repressor LexA [Pseudomonadales bacterium]
MEKLTPRQNEVLELIRSSIVETGYPPTRMEIADELGFRSPNAAEEHLRALERKGAIEMVPGASRGIRIPDMHEGIPIVGQVAAGHPILAEENIEEYCNIADNLFHPRAHYLLRVKGLSMKDIGIMDGDLLAVHKTEQAQNGQIVVARIEDEVTVKRYKKSRNKVFLFPENEGFEPIEINLKTEELTIEGRAVGIIRNNGL